MLDLDNILKADFVVSSLAEAQNQLGGQREAVKNNGVIYDSDIAASRTQSLIRSEISSQRQFAANARWLR